MHLAIIDLGTVSVRFEVYRIARACEQTAGIPYLAKQIHRERQMLRLGEELYRTQQLSKKGKERTLQTFRAFKKTLQAYPLAQICAVGTSALREANDGETFISQLSDVLEHEIQIISGQEEARLTAQGILANEPDISGFFAAIDIGGGSTEVSLCQDQEIILSTSLPLGAIRGHQLFLISSPPVQGQDNMGVVGFREHIREKLQAKEELKERRVVDYIIGSSGTIRSLCNLTLNQRTPDGTLTREEVHQLVSQMSLMSFEELCAICGMERNRADIILAGALIFEELMEFFSAPKVQASMFSLRHGLLDQEAKKALISEEI